MEVITMESDAYKRLVSKIEQIADFVAEAKLPSEEKKEAWLDSSQLCARSFTSPSSDNTAFPRLVTLYPATGG